MTWNDMLSLNFIKLLRDIAKKKTFTLPHVFVSGIVFVDTITLTDIVILGIAILIK